MRTSVTRPSASSVDVELQWDGGKLASLLADSQITPIVTSNNGRIADLTCVAGPGTARIVCFRLLPQEGSGAELRAFLRHGSDTLSETWSYLCS